MRTLESISEVMPGDRLVSPDNQAYIVVDVTGGKATVTRTLVISQTIGWKITDSYVAQDRLIRQLKQQIAEMEKSCPKSN